MNKPLLVSAAALLALVAVSVCSRMLSEPQKSTTPPAATPRPLTSANPVITENSSTEAPQTPVPVRVQDKNHEQSVLDRVFASDPALYRLSPEELSAFLEKNGHDPDAWLVTYRLSGDIALLRRAALEFPNSPQIQMQLAMSSKDRNERRRSIDAAKKTDPENSLGYYLSALDYFRDGNAEGAIKDLLIGSSKEALDDYALSTLQAAEEAYLSAGRNVAEAKAAATLGTTRQQAGPLRELSEHLSQLQKRYLQAGDQANANAVGNTALRLAGQIRDGGLLIDEFVGISIEKQFLATLPPQAQQQRTSELAARMRYLKDLNEAHMRWRSADSGELIAFLDRQKLYGEIEAMEWLQRRRTGK